MHKHLCTRKCTHTEPQIQNLRSQFACDKVAWRRLLLGSNRARLDVRSDEQLRRWIADSLQYRLRTHQARSIGSPVRSLRQPVAASLPPSHQDTSSNRSISKESSPGKKHKQHQRQPLKNTSSPEPPIISSTRSKVVCVHICVCVLACMHASAQSYLQPSVHGAGMRAFDCLWGGKQVQLASGQRANPACACTY